MDSTTPAIVDRLVTRIRQSGDFPAMAKTVGLISQLTSSEATSCTALADTILQDYGLTQKILCVVNSAAFAQHSQVTTISRAVFLMGFERIRSITTSLILFEHLAKQATRSDLADALTMSFYSALVSRSIASETAFVDPEEAFITALFHRLGRILVAFYLPEEQAAIAARMLEPGVREEAVVKSVLGLSYEDLGAEVATALSLPERLAQSMARVPGDRAVGNLDEPQRLACLATLSNDITNVLATRVDAKNKRSEVDRLLRSYRDHFQGVTKKMDGIIAGAVKELKSYSTSFRLDLPGSAFFAGLTDFRLTAAGGGAVAASSAAGALVAEDQGEAAPATSPDAILTEGLHELTGLLLGEYTLDDVLRVVLESVYRAMGVGRSRVLFFVKDPAAGVARFRFGLGQTTSDMKGWFEIPVSGAEDVFSLAMQEQKDIILRDLQAPEIAPLLPQWLKQRGIPNRCLVLLPLVVDKTAVGMFSLDGQKEIVPLLTPPVVNYLKVLRSQAVIAIRQRASRPPLRRS